MDHRSVLTLSIHQTPEEVQLGASRPMSLRIRSILARRLGPERSDASSRRGENSSGSGLRHLPFRSWLVVEPSRLSLAPGTPENQCRWSADQFLRDVGTFDPAAINEIRQNGAAPLERQATTRLHCSVRSLCAVVAQRSRYFRRSQNATHRRAGQLSNTGCVERSVTAKARGRTIDTSTKPFR